MLEVQSCLLKEVGDIFIGTIKIDPPVSFHI